MLITWCSLNLQSILKRFFCPLTLLHPKMVLPGKTFHLLRHNTYHLPRSTAIQDKRWKVWSLQNGRLSGLIYQKILIGLIIILLVWDNGYFGRSLTKVQGTIYSEVLWNWLGASKSCVIDFDQCLHNCLLLIFIFCAKKILGGNLISGRANPMLS